MSNAEEVLILKHQEGNPKKISNNKTNSHYNQYGFYVHPGCNDYHQYSTVLMFPSNVN